MPLRSIEQARASAAWGFAEDNRSDKFETIVTKIPTYIKTNGLLNTLAFLYSKKEYEPALTCIRLWLINPEFGQIREQLNTNAALMNYLVRIQPDNARLLIQYTSEIMALFIWLRRFVKSE